MGFQLGPDFAGLSQQASGAGLPGSPPREKFVKRQAVTGACALMRREVYDAVGGLDEKFLIGDFEDSDLCLKVREKGLEIACLPLPVTLIHLERQSFTGVGTPSFRDYVVRYNAWRHQTRGARRLRKCARRKTAGGLQMKAMVIAHAHPDFSVGGARSRPTISSGSSRRGTGFGDSIFLARSDLASQAHGSIMLRRPGE